MQRLGRALHVSSSRNIVVRTDKPPRIGERVVNEKLEPVGVVFDVFGPVSSPYVAVKSQVGNSESLVNHFLYVNPSARRENRKAKEKKG